MITRKNWRLEEIPNSEGLTEFSMFDEKGVQDGWVGVYTLLQGWIRVLKVLQMDHAQV